LYSFHQIFPFCILMIIFKELFDGQDILILYAI